MPLKLMYITNRPDVALIAEQNGVDRIFVDMEYIGKAERQGNLDTVKNHHTIQDVSALRKVLMQSELLVRVNPIVVDIVRNLVLDQRRHCSRRRYRHAPLFQKSLRSQAFSSHRRRAGENDASSGNTGSGGCSG